MTDQPNEPAAPAPERTPPTRWEKYKYRLRDARYHFLDGYIQTYIAMPAFLITAIVETVNFIFNVNIDEGRTKLSWIDISKMVSSIVFAVMFPVVAINYTLHKTGFVTEKDSLLLPLYKKFGLYKDKEYPAKVISECDYYVSSKLKICDLLLDNYDLDEVTREKLELVTEGIKIIGKRDYVIMGKNLGYNDKRFVGKFEKSTDEKIEALLKAFGFRKDSAVYKAIISFKSAELIPVTETDTRSEAVSFKDKKWLAVVNESRTPEKKAESVRSLAG